MTHALDIAAALLVAVGAAHSLLGERYILTRLFRRSALPPLFGGPEFTRRTLRFAWHLTTVAWWGLAAVLVLLAHGLATSANLLRVIGAIFGSSAVITAVASRGRHLAWVVFAAVAVLALMAAGR